MKRVLACLAVVVMMLTVGCGDDGESLPSKAGRKIGKGATDLVTGMGSGIDEAMQVNVSLGPGMTEKGFARTVSESTGLSPDKKGIAVYIISKGAYSGGLLAKALNKAGLEIGRSRADVEFGKDDAKYVTFMFDDEMDAALVRKYEVDLVK